eukprot:981739-Alexandrium_andersonii.AAC.1
MVGAASFQRGKGHVARAGDEGGRVLRALPEACREFRDGGEGCCSPSDSAWAEHLAHRGSIEPAPHDVPGNGVSQLVPGVARVPLDVGEADPAPAPVGLD